MKLIISYKDHLVDTSAGLEAIGATIGEDVNINRVHSWTVAPNRYGTLPPNTVEVEDTAIEGIWADFVDHYFNYYINGSGNVVVIPSAAMPSSAEISSRNVSAVRVDPSDPSSDLITDENDANMGLALVRAQQISIFDVI